jgi:curved DNA-binding protein
VPKTADQDAIKRAYRGLAKDLHPDKNPGNKAAETRFKAVNHAYEVLGNEGKRKLYDEFGEEGLREGFDANQARAYAAYRRQGRAGGGQDGGRTSWEDLFGGEQQGRDMGDVFGDLFGRAGGRKRARAPMKGADHESEVTIDFLSAVRGTMLELRAPSEEGSEPVKVRVPPGADEGSRVRIPGHGGESPNGGPKGDLILLVHVKPHPLLRREGDDLHLDVPITVHEAYRGGKITVPTLDGSVRVSVPPLTQSGTALRVRGKGVAKKGKKAGDLYVHFQVHIPIDEHAGPLIDKLAELDKSDPRRDVKL